MIISLPPSGKVTSMSTLPYVPSGILSLKLASQSGQDVDFTMELVTDCQGDFTLSPPDPMGQDQTLTIKGHGVKWIIFDLPDPRFVMIGIAFRVDGSNIDDSKVGLATFPYATVERYAGNDGYAGSVLTVCDFVHHQKRSFGFLIVMQDMNGRLLYFDPGIENDPTGH